MRPTDENQAGSRRPNLMSSSRRTNGDINILAMLDGQAPGRRIFARPAVFWYGAGGLVACTLLVVLAWLVRDGTPARDTETAGAARTTLRPTVPATGTAAAAHDAAHDAAAAAMHPGDVYAARAGTTVALPDTHAALAAEAPASAPIPPQPGEPRDAPAPATARGAVIVDAAPPTPAASPDPAAATPHAAAGPTVRAQAPAARHTPVRPQTPALAHAEPAPRQRRGTSRTAPSSATVDSDVALISAILQHTGARNDAADAAGRPACADRSCNPRLPSRQ